jgi:CBS domain-containing protein
MLIRDAMTSQVEWIGPNISLFEAARTMRDKNIGCLPISENDRLIGMITDRDLVCRAIAEGADPRATNAKAVMTKGVTWCFDDESLDDAVARMGDKHIHHMPVLNREKRMVGILSLSDLARRAPKGLSKQVSELTSRSSARHASGAQGAAPTAH